MELVAILIFCLSVFNNGADVSIGVAMDDDYNDSVISPIGTLRVETPISNNVRMYGMHQSSLPDPYDNRGLNTVGIELTVHIDGK